MGSTRRMCRVESSQVEFEPKPLMHVCLLRMQYTMQIWQLLVGQLANMQQPVMWIVS